MLDVEEDELDMGEGGVQEEAFQVNPAYNFNLHVDEMISTKCRFFYLSNSLSLQFLVLAQMG